MTDGQHWPLSRSLLEPQQALVIGLLLLMAVMGKSALVPLSGWLPRAMEGPTASSAIFYGALSVHLGAYLLLRIAPIIAASPALAWIIVLLGATTAAFANMVQRVQADIKSLLAFASLTQVGLIVAEIGMGWTWFPLVHLLGHAILRTVQLLRAPSLLQDYWHLESALGQRIAHRPDRPGMNYSRFHIWLYRFSLQRGFLDSSLDRFLVAPIISQLHRCCNLEQVWTRWLTGRLMKTFQWNHLRPLLQAIIPDKATLSEGTNLPASVASSLDPIQTGQSPAVMPNDSEST
jgi:NAD(P)H-quinone oxidoreductase subunit 5